VTLWLCVAPLWLGGLRGKKSTPSVWLGGTGELIDVGKQEQEQERKQHEERDAARMTDVTRRKHSGQGTLSVE